MRAAEPPPLLPGHDAATLREALEQVASHDEPESAAHARTWKLYAGDEPDPIADALASTLMTFLPYGKPKTRITVTIAEPGKSERAWSWFKDPDA